MDYFPWVVDEDDISFSWITEQPESLQSKDYLLDDGVSVRSWFPKDLAFDLSPDHGSRLTDFIPNTMDLLIVSEKLKNILADHANFEFFEVKIRNPKGRFVKKQYFLANLLDVVSCADMNRSEYIMNPIIKNQVRRFFRLYLHESKIPEEKSIFRLGEMTWLILVSEALVDRILDQNCQGMIFQYLDDYGSEFRP